MKMILVLASLLAAPAALADTVPCKGKAIRAAMSRYLESGPIQGDDPTPSHELLERRGDRVVHQVWIDGGNDEGETWSIEFIVTTRGSGRDCRVLEVAQAGEDE